MSANHFRVRFVSSPLAGCSCSRLCFRNRCLILLIVRVRVPAEALTHRRHLPIFGLVFRRRLDATNTLHSLARQEPMPVDPQQCR